MNNADLLLEIARCAILLDLYVDFGTPFDCPHCSPDDAVPIRSAMKALHEAIEANRRFALGEENTEC